MGGTFQKNTFNAKGLKLAGVLTRAKENYGQKNNKAIPVLRGKLYT